jgi:hypothetical protein
MDRTIQELLHTHIQRRQLEIWNAIVKNYAIADSLDSQVRKWILEDKISEKAFTVGRKNG